MCNRSIEGYGQRRLGRDTRTLHESWTVVESDTPGCKCAFGATMDPILARLEAVRGGTSPAIESPWSRGPRRAAPGSFHAVPVAYPQRFWDDSYVYTGSIESYGQRRLGRTPRTLHESWTVVESDTPGSKCAFGAIS